SHSHPVPAFRPFHKVGEEEYLGRPFIEGGRLDLVSRWDLNFAQLLRYAAGLGEVYAVNLQALRVVEDHEILVTAEALGRPKKLESIGTWEAFFNNSGANTAEELFELLTPFYGAALAGWLASAEFGKFGSTRTIEGVQQVKAQMVEVFKRAFCLRFEGSRYQWDEVRDGTLQSYLEVERDLGRLLSDEFNLTQSLALVDSVLKSDPKKVFGLIHNHAERFSRYFERVLHGIPVHDETGMELFGQRDRIIVRLSDLLRNHNLEPDSLSQIETLLDEFDFSQYTPLQRSRLIGLIDVAQSMRELGFQSRFKALWSLPITSSDDFIQSVREIIPRKFLSGNQIRLLYEAISSCLNDLAREGLGSERSRRIQGDLERICGVEIFPRS
ncbi:MAG: hypothetical protein KDD60_05075, partial [Bdellovibrionales bacterium]|nr:hypothetical protein [Bdellovibrionales bacterium]